MAKQNTAKPTRRPIIDALRAPEPEEGESGFFSANTNSGRRSLEAMLLSLPDELDQAQYAQQRIRSYEDQISKVLEAIKPMSRDILLTRKPEWRRYLKAPESPPVQLRQKAK